MRDWVERGIRGCLGCRRRERYDRKQLSLREDELIGGEG